MNSGILPPAASWYLSSILACNDDGLLAYGSRNEINFFRINEGKDEYSVIQLAHSERINCLVFSPNFSSFKNCIASSADDGLVRIWDVITLELKLSNSGHKDGLKITGLDWSVADPNLVVSMNETGNIVCWDLPSNTFRSLKNVCNTGSKISPLCLACCPHDKDIIAIGGKSGFIAIINIKGEGKSIFRVKGHEGDVLSVSWCPVPDNILSPESGQTENDNTLLLASAGFDKCIYIWKAGVDMRYTARLFLPNQPVGQVFRKKMFPEKETVPSSNFTCVRWVDPYQILSSSVFGELLSWNIRKIISNLKNQDKKKGQLKSVQPRLIHSVHLKGLFSIACLISSERNIDSKQDNRMVWTTAVDRHLTCCNIGNGQVIHDRLSIGSIVYCLALSPIDPNSLAIGTGEGKILIWNMSCKEPFKDIYIHWRKINGKVMSLAWHPTDEQILAFGTVDGRIGLVTVCSEKFPVILRLYHRKPVYTLQWAHPIFPTGMTKPGQLALYSVGDKEVVQYCKETPGKDPISLEPVLMEADISAGIKHSSRCDFAMKDDSSVYAVANENGSVHIISCEDHTRLYTVYAHKKAVNALVWHPPTVANSCNSCYKNWLASGAENIKVVSIPADKDSTVETIATLVLHGEKIACLSWSPHFSAQLVSASYDGSTQIWDVLTQSLLASYTKHTNAVLCALWSPFDPDFVISGSYDNTLQVWRISEQVTVIPVKRKQLVSQFTKERQAVPSAKSLISDDPQTAIGVPSKSLNTTLLEDQPLERNKGFEDFNKRQRARSFFPISSVALQNPKHVDVLYNRVVLSEPDSMPAAVETQDLTLTENSAVYLDYFGDKKAMRKLLMVEESHLQEIGNHLQTQHHAMWRGDVTEMLEEATKKKQLSDWLISIAPMGSYTMWSEMCSAYAEQLIECGEYVKAASYLLALHKVEEAILLLTEHNLYKEALAIAKSRYPEDDPTIELVLNKWGQYSNINGQLMLAAHCFIATGDYLAASDVLVRCKDLKSLKLAAMLAEKAGAVERSKILFEECLLLGLQHANYKVVEEIIKEKPEYLEWSLLLEACQIVSSMKKNKKHCDELHLSWLKQECTTESILDRMKPICSKVGKDYVKLMKYVAMLKTPTSDKELWYIVSSHIALLCATYYDAGRPNLFTLQHCVRALACAYQFQTTHDVDPSLLQICYFFSPQGPFSPGSIFISPCETEEEKQLIKSARAFMCAGIVYWLANNIFIKETISETKQLDWLVELLDKCQADVLDPESFCFFKIKTQKQLLLDSVAKEKAEKNKILNKNLTKREVIKKSKQKKMVEKEENENSECDKEKSNIELKNVNESNLSGEVTENSSNDGIEAEFESHNKYTGFASDMNGLTDEVLVEENGSGDGTKAYLKPQNTNNTATNLNGSTGEVFVQENSYNEGSTISCNDKTNIPKEESKDVTDSKQENYDEELEKMDDFLKKFKESRVSAPNPFVACSNIKCAINYYIKHLNPDLANEMDEKCNKIWQLCGKNNV